MLSKNLKILLSGILVGLLLYIGSSYGINKLRGNTGLTQPIVISQVKSNLVDNNILHKETVVSKFNTIQKIQVIQTSVKQEVNINNGYQNNFFKNDKKIVFTGIGTFNLDLSIINSNNITINNTDRTISLTISKPTVQIELLEDKTTFQDDKGYLAFYDIKMSPEEFEQMKYSVKEQMGSKLESESYDSIVKEKTKESIENILNKLTGSNYIINITFVE